MHIQAPLQLASPQARTLLSLAPNSTMRQKNSYRYISLRCVCVRSLSYDSILVVDYFIKSTYIAAIIQLPDTHKLSLSPIRLAFHAIPRKPVCDLTFLESLNISGRRERAKVALQINNSSITSSEGKSNNALIFLSRKQSTKTGCNLLQR